MHALGTRLGLQSLFENVYTWLSCSMSAFYGLIKVCCGARLDKEQTFAGSLYFILCMEKQKLAFIPLMCHAEQLIIKMLINDNELSSDSQRQYF